MSRKHFCGGRSASTLRSFAVLGLAAIACSAHAESVGGPALRALVSDRDIYLDLTKRHTLGWSTGQWHFRSDGSVTGYLFSSAYIGGHRPGNSVDNGNWWVSEDKLCLQWSAWSGGAQHCYTVSAHGNGYRAAGDSGLLGGAFSIIK